MSDYCLFKSTCDKQWAAIQSITKQNMELETKLQTATEALEHYASENNWAHSNFDERGFYADEYMLYRHGYLKAREALRVIRGEE